MQYLILILIKQTWFELRIQMLWVEVLHYKKRPRELLICSQGIAIQALYFWNLNYLNSMIKSFLKMYFWQVNLSIVSCHQSTKIGSLFAPILIAMRQSHPQLVNCLNLLFAITYIEKKLITISAIDAWNNSQTNFSWWYHSQWFNSE